MLLQPAGALTAGISFSGSWCHNSSLLENWKIFVHWFVNWSYFNCRHKVLGIKFLRRVETLCHLCQCCVLTYCTDSNEKWHQSHKRLVTWLIYRANDSVKFRLSTHLSVCYVDCFQAASLFPGTSPPGRDYVQWEHEALATQDAVWQVSQCPCGDQPWGSHYFNLPVTHGVVPQRRYRLSSTGKYVILRAVNSLC